MEAIALTNALTEEKGRLRSGARREGFQEGDLVLVWDLRRDKVSKDKMTPKWFGLRKIVKINPGRVTALISRLHRNKTSKYHLDDLRIYFRWEQEDFHYQESAPVPPLEVERTAMSMALLLGQRSVDLRGLYRHRRRGRELGPLKISGPVSRTGGPRTWSAKGSRIWKYKTGDPVYKKKGKRKKREEFPSTCWMVWRRVIRTFSGMTGAEFSLCIEVKCFIFDTCKPPQNTEISAFVCWRKASILRVVDTCTIGQATLITKRSIIVIQVCRVPCMKHGRDYCINTAWKINGPL